MSWEIDHLLVGVAGAEVAETALEAAGLPVTARRIHPGQGTANACTHFEGASLELFWCVDSGEIRSEAVRPLGLDSRLRWRQTGDCPFGLCLRSSHGQIDPADLPFDTWPYAAPFLPGVELPVVTPRYGVYEPLLFLSFGAVTAMEPRSGTPSGERGELARKRVTAVRLRTPCRLSPGARWFADRGLFSCEESAEPGMEIELDGGAADETKGLGAGVPVVVRW